MSGKKKSVMFDKNESTVKLGVEGEQVERYFHSFDENWKLSCVIEHW